MAALLQKAW